MDRLPRTPKGWRTREKLIEAAIVVINRNGYSAATVEEIVKQAKLPIGSFYRHFKNRADITHSALEQVAAEYRQGVFSMSPRNALFQREVVVHNLLYETLERHARFLSCYFVCRAEDEVLLDFLKGETKTFVWDYYSFVQKAPGNEQLAEEEFDALGYALVGISENSLYRLFSGLDNYAGDIFSHRPLMVGLMSELRYRALTLKDPDTGKAPHYWTLSLSEPISAKARNQLISEAFSPFEEERVGVAAPSPRRADLKATLNRIESSTLERLSNRNLKDVKLSDIEKASGVTRGAIYYHYTDKNTLVRKVIVDRLQKLEEDSPPPSADAPYGAVFETIRPFVATFAEAPGLLRAIGDLETDDETIATAYRAYRAALARRLAGIFLAFGRARTLAPETLRFATFFIVSMMERFVRDRFVLSTPALEKATPKTEDATRILAAIICRMAWRLDPEGGALLPLLIEEAEPKGARARSA